MVVAGAPMLMVASAAKTSFVSNLFILSLVVLSITLPSITSNNHTINICFYDATEISLENHAFRKIPVQMCALPPAQAQATVKFSDTHPDPARLKWRCVDG